MNQEKIGKFIAELRKEKGLTQPQLAEHFDISNKAVSKWGTGKSLPDASIMIDLCNLLGITVNELLRGERIRMEDYKEKAEEKFVEMHAQKSKIQKVAFAVFWLFMLVTFMGITFVLMNQGRVRAGYAVIPAVIAIISISIYRKKAK